MTHHELTFLEKEREYLANRIPTPDVPKFSKNFEDRFIESLVSKEPIREYQKDNASRTR